MPRLSWLIVLSLHWSLVVAAWAEMTIDLRESAPRPLTEAVLFPFDKAGLPFRHGLQMELLPSKRTDDPNPVLTRGPAGAPDDRRINYYGSVILIGDTFHMWYLADGALDPIAPGRSTPIYHICYARSKNGFDWEKPELGLVEYNGTKQNNLIDVGQTGQKRTCTVIYEPEDPDPARRFKLFFQSNDSRGHVAFSQDGLKFTASAHNPVTSVQFEGTGLIKCDGLYYAIGQAAGREEGFQHRVLVAFVSEDFEHWSEAVIPGFRRDPVPPRGFHEGYAMGPQVHLGAGFWDRGNVFIGLYGQWNGAPNTDDRRFMTMNLGLLVTHDGIHYEEPIPDFKMIRAVEEGWTDEDPIGFPPRLVQGQGMVNFEDRTMTWYGHWGRGGNTQIRVALWERDRLGFYSPTRTPIEGQSIYEDLMSHCVSCPIQPGADGGRVYLNADGFSDDSELRVELQGRDFRPIPGYRAEECEPVRHSGFRVPVRWRERDTIQGIDGPYRVRVNWGGKRFEDPRLYAIYIANE